MEHLSLFSDLVYETKHKRLLGTDSNTIVYNLKFKISLIRNVIIEKPCKWLPLYHYESIISVSPQTTYVYYKMKCT